MVQCCGNRFCESCIGRIVESKALVRDTACPLCKQNITASMPDKQLERLLKEKLVYCSNKACGCTWTGELGQLEEGHLNMTPLQGKLMDGCLYVEVLCSQCQRMKVKRHAMKNHMQKECPKRIALCTYCKKHRAAYEDISRIHHPVCQYVPEPCPKGCGAKPLRKNIAKHVADWCPKNPQPCPFHIVGCTKKLTGWQMENHLSDSAVFTSHLSDVKKMFDALKKEIGEKDTEMKTLQENLRRKVKDLQSEMERKELDMRMLTEHKDKLISDLKDELAANEKGISILQGQVRGKEQEVKALRQKLDRVMKVHAQEVKEKTATLKENTCCINALLKEIKEKDKQIEKLRRKCDQSDNAELWKCTKLLKVENAELQKCTSSLEAKIEGMMTNLMELEQKAYNKAIHADTLEKTVTELQQVILDQKRDIKRLPMMAIHADTLEKTVTELQQVILDQKRDIKRLTTMAEQRYDEADKREETLHKVRVPFDGGKHADSDSNWSVTTREDSLNKQPVNPPAKVPVNPPIATDVNVPVNQPTHVPVNLPTDVPINPPTAANVPLNPFADDSGVLGAALGVAVGVGIAGVAALLRR